MEGKHCVWGWGEGGQLSVVFLVLHRPHVQHWNNFIPLIAANEVTRLIL